jgi:uncharacterized protein YydD (DUF2326 family)
LIHGVYANQKGFRSVQFEAGLNLIVADRSQKAGDKDTTNGVGKSALIDIIDYCLGSGPKPKEGLRVEPLSDWAFTLDITLGGAKVRVTRHTNEPGFVEVEGDVSTWPAVRTTNKTGQVGFDIKQWRSLLGWALFGVGDKANVATYAPSARSLLSYFIRNHPPAYLSPFTHFEKQKTWDAQLHNAFLLGLDWEKAAKWQVLKDQKNALDALKKAIKTGAIDGELSSIGELEAQRIQIEGRLIQENEALANFQVLPQYRQTEQEANRLTSQIHALVNSNMTARRRIERYTDNLQDEGGAPPDRLEGLYSEAQIVFPDLVKKTLEQARNFNSEIVKNRRHFLGSEVAELQARVTKQEEELAQLSSDRASLLNLLKGHGALEELTALQEMHATTRTHFEALIARINQLRQMETRLDQIKVETVDLKRSADLDYEERRAVWSKALRLFADNSEQLYKKPGRLLIDIDDTGYRYDVEIDGGSSEGIGKMKIFCYDLMLVSFARERGLGIDFLIHDSTIFDGVDPRQRAHAIELARQMSEKYGFQYILTLNSDALPANDFSDNFGIDGYIRLVLTDTDPSGGLFGFRYKAK